SEPLDARSLEGVATHPVVYVSWYEAMAYGRWLTSQVRMVGGRGRPLALGLAASIVRLLCDGDAASGGQPWVITLPSEAEWERAARGPASAWRYPWGDAWDANRANGWEADEAAIEGTSAVGGYPGGASPAPE